MEIFTHQEIRIFEELWVKHNKYGKYQDQYKLDPDDYINYHIWCNINNDKMHKKHLPNTMVVSGINPNIIFHGGCLGCKSQRLHGINRCKGCSYFGVSNSNQSLFIDGEDSATLGQDDIDNIFKL